MAKEKEIAEEYASSLADLTVNSKPLINMLTILAEENVEHAGVIVETVEKHLEKVHPDVKLPVLYLVDSIIKNVGGAYTQKFSQSIVNMFTRTFKQVDEKIRSQMFKLRETWHDVFPATKLYQLDVKVNLIDPAWPIQAQPHPQSNIHNVPTTSTSASAPAPLSEEDERMRTILAKKEQELLMLQQKKIEMQLEQTRRQLELAEKNAKKTPAVIPMAPPAPTMPVATVTPVATHSTPALTPAAPALAPELGMPVRSRLGPPVNKPTIGRIAPVSAALLAARRDPRLSRLPHAPIHPVLPTTHAPIASNVFDIKPLDRVTKRKNVITYDVQPELRNMRRDPRFDKRKEKARLRDERRKEEERKREERKVEENNRMEDKEVNSGDKYIDTLIAADPKRINKLPPIPKLNRNDKAAPPIKKRKEIVKVDKKKNKDDGSSKEGSSGSSPEKKAKGKDVKKKTKERRVEEEKETPADPEEVAFKELRNYHKERYMRRNKQKSESPEPHKMEETPIIESSNVPEVLENKDVDLRVLPAVDEKPALVAQKRPSTETVEGKTKKNKLDKFDILFGNEDVDLRQLPQVEEMAPPPPSIGSPISPKVDEDHRSPLRSPKRDKDLRSLKKDKDLRSPLSPEKDNDLRSPLRSLKNREHSSPQSPDKDKDLRSPLRSHKKDKDLRSLLSPEKDNQRSPLKSYKKDRDLRSPLSPENDKDVRTSLSPDKDRDLRLPLKSFKKGKELRPPLSPEKDKRSHKKDKNLRIPLGSDEDKDLRAPLSPERDHHRSLISPEKDDDFRSPMGSPKKDWNEVKEKEDVKKTPSKLDLVRAKLAEATKGKDRLGRPLLFSKSPSIERERRRTLSSEDLDLRNDHPEEFDAEDHKKTISIIMNQAKEQFTDGQLDKNQYNTLMYQVLQLNEKLKLKEAKQRESLELSKRKLKAHIQEQNHKDGKPMPNIHNNFGDIDERVTPAVFMDTPPDSQGFQQDSDMRMNMVEKLEPPRVGLLPAPPQLPGMFGMQYPTWRGPRPRMEEFGPRRFRGPMPFFRGKFEKRGSRPFERMPVPLPTPKIGMGQCECPLRPYERTDAPPPLGAPGVIIPSTDYKILEYIDQDPVKTIQIDGIPREIRWYGETAIIMMDWDDPREIQFLPGCRRVTFDNKDSIVLNFNEPYKQVEIDDQVFDIRFGAPTRELFINGRWWECFFGGQPLGVIIEGKPRLVHLEGPLPQVDIGKIKRTDLVAGKINLIVNATQMCPVYLDAKVQKVMINGQYFTIRFVDALKTVLINEQPFQVEFGDLPKPITIGMEKYFIRFSALPRNVKPGYVNIANMEGSALPALMPPTCVLPMPAPMEIDQDLLRPMKTPSPEAEHQGLDMLASVMPSNMEMEAPPSATEYSSAEPLFSRPDRIPGLETPSDEKPVNLPVLGNINVTDLFAKLVATGIVQMTNDGKDVKEDKKEDVAKPAREDKTKIHRVDLLRPETLRVKQPGLVAKLYGGMQCSGCGARFPPEHTVRYSQHLDWHFRQNRRDRDSARRAHSRHWHYDLSDWVQYEEIEDLEEREKSWFETGGNEGEPESAAEAAEEAPSVAAGAPVDCHCALCGDKFDQFYNEDKEEWHLRNSVRHEDKNYHPLCFEDYKASLTKEEPAPLPTDEIVTVDKEEESIAIDADDTNSQSDNEVEVVEVVDAEEKQEAPLEIEEEQSDGEEDDVVLKAEPVEQVTVEDDADTDDETAAARGARDQLAFDMAKVKVKQEPVDPDDEPIITSEVPNLPHTTIDTTHTTVLSSIDGNLQLESASAPAQAIPSGGIRINISKTMPIHVMPINTFITTGNDDRMLEDISADDEPPPPGEEPELVYTLKPELEGIQFSRQPPVQKGNELSGLCSIM